MKRKKRDNVIKNTMITLGILTAAALTAFLLQHFVSTDTHVPLLFVLAVLFISRFTDGYIYGIAASAAAIICVNYVFTYPYFEINFTLTGYPLTFVAMLAVSLSVSTLTTQIKQQEHIRLEVEKEKMRGNLLRAVSHDIRTPLTSIVGSASGILDNESVLPREHMLELVKDIREEAQWLIRIVENLLSVTRINGEKCADSYGGRDRGGNRGQRGAEISEAFSGGEGGGSHAGSISHGSHGRDTDRTGARESSGKFSSARKDHRSDQDHRGKLPGRLLVAVEDDGEGIRESVLPVIFEGGLHSGEGEECDSGRNMGIGLSVCMSIVRAHKGDMEAENRKEGGARVSFWLSMEEKDGYQR